MGQYVASVESESGDTVRRLSVIAVILLLGAEAFGQKASWWNDAAFSDAVIVYPFTNASGTTVSDKSANGNHGTVSTGVIWTNFGSGGAMKFTGGGTNFMTIVKSASMDFGTNITVCLWYRQESTANLNGFALGSRQPIYTNQPGWQFYGVWNSGSIYYCDVFPKGASANGYRRHATNTLSADWHHAACTMASGTNLHFWLDGVERGANAGTPGSFFASTNNWYIGARPVEEGGATTGTYASIVIWPSTKTIADITNHMYVTGTTYVDTASTRVSQAPILDFWRSLQ